MQSSPNGQLFNLMKRWVSIPVPRQKGPIGRSVRWGGGFQTLRLGTIQLVQKSCPSHIMITRRGASTCSRRRWITPQRHTIFHQKKKRAAKVFCVPRRRREWERTVLSVNIYNLSVIQRKSLSLFFLIFKDETLVKYKKKFVIVIVRVACNKRPLTNRLGYCRPHSAVNF